MKARKALVLEWLVLVLGLLILVFFCVPSLFSFRLFFSLPLFLWDWGRSGRARRGVALGSLFLFRAMGKRSVSGFLGGRPVQSAGPGTPKGPCLVSLSAVEILDNRGMRGSAFSFCTGSRKFCSNPGEKICLNQEQIKCSDDPYKRCVRNFD